MTKKGLVSLALAVLALGTTACSSDGDHGSSPSPRAMKLLTLKASATFEGALTGQLTFTASRLSPRATSCEALARHGSASTSSAAFAVPTPRTARGKFLRWIATIRPYRGARTYDAANVPGFRVIVVEGTHTTRYLKTADTSTIVTVERDGSGELEFNDLIGPSRVKLAGKIHWTCTP